VDDDVCSLDFAPDGGWVNETIILPVPNEIGYADVLAAQGHFDERADSLGCHVGQEVVGGLAAYVVEVLVAPSSDHELEECAIFVGKVFVDDIEEPVPRLVVRLVLTQLVQQVFVQQLFLEVRV
jgi:hypothetical protein